MPYLYGITTTKIKIIMKKRIERKFERIEAIRCAALKHRGIYAEVAREWGWRRDYVCSVMAGRNSSDNVLRALEQKLHLERWSLMTPTSDSRPVE